jgi:aspartate aminotransferase
MSVKTKSRLSQLVQNMSESETIKMAQMARNLKAQGHDVISLSLGEPDFDTPDHIKMAAIKALTEGFTKYTPVPGIPDLLDAISKKFKRDSNLDYAPNQIVVSNGAKQSIANVALALLEAGDECIIFAPYWVSYLEIVKMTGATPVIVSAGVEQDFKVSGAQVEAAITDKTKMILFSSPCNPTGSVFSKSEIKDIAEVIEKYDDIYVVSDEIYEYINFTENGHFSIGSLDSMRERTITVNGFAKGFAMTGWRLGYIGAPKWIADACNKIQSQFTSGANSFSQKAAVSALTSSLEPTFKMRDEFKRRRDIVVALLSDIPGFRVPTPQGAFYMFPEISEYFGKSDGTVIIKNADDFCDYIMLNSFVGLVSGSAFGAPNCFRLSYAASEEQLREAVRRIAEVCARLR